VLIDRARSALRPGRRPLRLSRGRAGRRQGHGLIFVSNEKSNNLIVIIPRL